MGSLSSRHGLLRIRFTRASATLTLPTFAFTLYVDGALGIEASQGIPDQGVKVFLAGLGTSGNGTENRAAVACQVFQVQHLAPARSKA